MHDSGQNLLAVKEHILRKCLPNIKIPAFMSAHRSCMGALSMATAMCPLPIDNHVCIKLDCPVPCVLYYSCKLDWMYGLHWMQMDVLHDNNLRIKDEDNMPPELLTRQRNYDKPGNWVMSHNYTSQYILKCIWIPTYIINICKYNSLPFSVSIAIPTHLITQTLQYCFNAWQFTQHDILESSIIASK